MACFPKLRFRISRMILCLYLWWRLFPRVPLWSIYMATFNYEQLKAEIDDLKRLDNDLREAENDLSDAEATLIVASARADAALGKVVNLRGSRTAQIAFITGLLGVTPPTDDPTPPVAPSEPF